MILFRPYMVPWILSDPPRKTQTRRTWDRWMVREGKVYQAKTQLFGEPFAHIYIKRRWIERVQDISESDAKAEGYASRMAFLEMWAKNYGGIAQRVRAIEFQVVGVP